MTAAVCSQPAGHPGRCGHRQPRGFTVCGKAYEPEAEAAEVAEVRRPLTAERLATIRSVTHGPAPVPNTLHVLVMAAQLLEEVDRLNGDVAEARTALVARRRLLVSARTIVDAIHLREPIPRGGFVITLEGAHMGDVSRVQFELRKELEEIEEPAFVQEVSSV